MLSRSPADAERKRDPKRCARRRRYRLRQAAGMACLRVEVSEHDLAEALLRSGRLTPEQALHRAEIEQAVASLGIPRAELANLHKGSHKLRSRSLDEG